MNKQRLRFFWKLSQVWLREAFRLVVSGQTFPRRLIRPLEPADRIGKEIWRRLNKLHVGCGNVILESYTNVDLPAENGSYTDIAGVQTPVVRTSLTDLSQFPEASVDVIEGYHVIEHLPSWEGRRALKEFFRILKPTGELVLECPDLFKCSLNYLVKPGDPKLAMNGLYSDQSSESPAMVHQYGYDPKSLADALVQAGFPRDRIIEIPARRYRQRDLRLVACKSGVSVNDVLARASEHMIRDTITFYQCKPAASPVAAGR